MAAAQAVLGGANASETAAVEAQLQASVVEHSTFDQLTDLVTVNNLELETVFIPEIIENAINTCDE